MPNEEQVTAKAVMPWYQKIVLAVGVILGAYLAFGAVVGALNDAETRFASFRSAALTAATSFVLWMLCELAPRIRPVPWTFGRAKIAVSGPGPKFRLTMIGIILLPLSPYAVRLAMEGSLDHPNEKIEPRIRTLEMERDEARAAERRAVEESRRDKALFMEKLSEISKKLDAPNQGRTRDLEIEASRLRREIRRRDEQLEASQTRSGPPCAPSAPQTFTRTGSGPIPKLGTTFNKNCESTLLFVEFAFGESSGSRCPHLGRVYLNEQPFCQQPAPGACVLAASAGNAVIDIFSIYGLTAPDDADCAAIQITMTVSEVQVQGVSEPPIGQTMEPEIARSFIRAHAVPR
jgi:hypothetical protein